MARNKLCPGASVSARLSLAQAVLLDWPVQSSSYRPSSVFLTHAYLGGLLATKGS